MFSRILVGIDGSEYSRNAVNYALDLTSKYESELFLLAIVPSKVHHGDSSGVFGMVAPSYFQEYKKEAEKWFEEIIAHINKNTNIDAKTKVKSEVITTPFSIAASILNYAEERNVELIVIGTRGNSGLKKMLLGSVATDVVTYAYCPVLVIK
ncbi:universal stress protein [Candidatus Nitrosocosmicus franklandus]|uniref:Putative universal stress protein n=1 Tax=Candidatus Nitrosocosmicus franklandianus TaxID=1798806 RepID=A0A484I7U6_9ARCH|nr:universal stress protein [Candidatus Nitrosocosmicus franklandus]VFJ13819.1 putative universal stress protein [Candidatus Nitrosocosmicus franklandus]